MTAAQRSRIYQTVVRERVVPRTVITERTVVPGIPVIGAPVVREQIITERLVTAPPVRETFGAAPFVTAPAGAERVVTTDVDADLTVGSRIPATVPIYAVPETLARQIPAIQPYRYAIVEDRVLLVDPVTNVIVAEFDQ